MFDESTGGRHRSRGRSKSPVPGSGTKYSSAADVGATALAVEERTGNLNRQEMLSNWRKENNEMYREQDVHMVQTDLSLLLNDPLLDGYLRYWTDIKDLG